MEGSVRETSGGPLAPPRFDNLYRAFQATVDQLGDAPALRWGDGESMSWSELSARAARG